MQANIKGTTMPILEVALNDGEEVISTHGELAWMTQSIQLSQRMGTGGGPGGGFMAGLKRAAGGGGVFITHYGGPGAITFAAKVPGHIMPVEIDPGQSYFVHRHGWLCGTPGVGRVNWSRVKALYSLPSQGGMCATASMARTWAG